MWEDIKKQWKLGMEAHSYCPYQTMAYTKDPVVDLLKGKGLLPTDSQRMLIEETATECCGATAISCIESHRGEKWDINTE